MSKERVNLFTEGNLAKVLLLLSKRVIQEKRDTIEGINLVSEVHNRFTKAALLQAIQELAPDFYDEAKAILEAPEDPPKQEDLWDDQLQDVPSEQYESMRLYITLPSVEWRIIREVAEQLEKSVGFAVSVYAMKGLHKLCVEREEKDGEA